MIMTVLMGASHWVFVIPKDCKEVLRSQKSNKQTRFFVQRDQGTEWDVVWEQTSRRVQILRSSSKQPRCFAWDFFCKVNNLQMTSLKMKMAYFALRRNTIVHLSEIVICPTSKHPTCFVLLYGWLVIFHLLYNAESSPWHFFLQKQVGSIQWKSRDDQIFGLVVNPGSGIVH